MEQPLLFINNEEEQKALRLKFAKQMRDLTEREKIAWECAFDTGAMYASDVYNDNAIITKG